MELKKEVHLSALTKIGVFPVPKQPLNYLLQDRPLIKGDTAIQRYTELKLEPEPEPIQACRRRGGAGHFT